MQTAAASAVVIPSQAAAPTCRASRAAGSGDCPIVELAVAFAEPRPTSPCAWATGLPSCNGRVRERPMLAGPHVQTIKCGASKHAASTTQFPSALSSSEPAASLVGKPRLHSPNVPRLPTSSTLELSFAADGSSHHRGSLAFGPILLAIGFRAPSRDSQSGLGWNFSSVTLSSSLLS